MLTENQFEEIFNEIQNQKEIIFTDIPGFDHFDLSDQRRIIREWDINNSEDSMIDLANKIVITNDGEPITEVRIAKKLGITITLAKKIHDYVIDCLDGKIERISSGMEISAETILKRIETLINDINLEPGRRKALKEEFDGICKKGDLARMIIAMKAASFFRENKYLYRIKGDLTSSLVAYHLGIHDIDCFKCGCDYHLCHGLNFEKKYDLEFEVSSENLPKAILNIEDLFFYEPFLRRHTDDVPVNHSSFYFTHNKKIYKLAKTYTDINDKDYQCLTPEQALKYKDNVISLHITSSWQLTFLERMNQIHPIAEIDVNNIEPLMRFVQGGSLFNVDEKIISFMKETFMRTNKLTYDQLVDIICYFHSVRDCSYKYLNERMINTREEVIEILSKNCFYEEAFEVATSANVGKTFANLELVLDYDIVAGLTATRYLSPKAIGVAELNDIIRECFYFVKYPEESMETILETLYTKYVHTNLSIGSNLSKEDEYFRKIMSDYHSIFADRYIGIFFYIEGKLRFYKEKLVIDKNKIFIDVDKGHFDLFNTYRMPKEKEYSMFPRGRILYNVETNTFYLYADKTILSDKAKIKELREEFNLPKYGVRRKMDEHYKTLRY